ncbi:hypothetical protein P872_25205 [Rhodonellum psychrophilum GCM71 = DSM 17998]|uniref:DUF4494 domain-containing protein n=2 Tax=Rhodonellum TaxID=336827 RepID=U5C8E4_9BACT|nr:MULTISPECIES: DUF4494 domain-containing protein [Rhodonellum]ERM84457.1 hypothetical protein P872_25205 [Rhodonellum psychrophilum GCM71 = DSM 17998]SDZ00577.1 protein of unknown function [Rhodonellum ikkaensis]
MRTWFLCKVKYAKENEQGLLKNVSEQYLVDAVSFTEAEARIYDMLGSVIRGDFQVTNISKSNIVDVFYYEDIDVWHKCKITYLVTDADSGKEKKVTQFMLVTAHDVKEAHERIFESLNNMLVTFRVPEIAESPIVEIFPYEKEDEELLPPPGANLRPVSEVKAEQERRDQNRAELESARLQKESEAEDEDDLEVAQRSEEDEEDEF